MDAEQVALEEGEDEPTPPPKKGVRFHKRGSIEEVKRISRISMYNPEEIIAYWGDSEEHLLRKEELKKAVLDLHRGRRSSDNFSFTSIGIEGKVGEGRALRKEMRWKSRNAVFDEQAWQEAEGARDDEQLADIYKVTTQDALVMAQDVAKRVAEDVGKFQGSGGLENITLD